MHASGCMMFLPRFYFTAVMMRPDISDICLFICLQVGAMPSEALGLSPVATYSAGGRSRLPFEDVLKPFSFAVRTEFSLRSNALSHPSLWT